MDGKKKARQVGNLISPAQEESIRKNTLSTGSLKGNTVSSGSLEGNKI